MALSKDTLMQHGYRQLAIALRAMRGGSIGFDLFRNPETRLKGDLAEFMLREHTEEQIRAAFAAVGLSLTEPELPRGEVPQGHGRGRGSGDDGQGDAESDGEGESEGGGEGSEVEEKDEKEGDSGQGEQGEEGEQQGGKQQDKQGKGKGKAPTVPPPQQGEHRHPLFEKVLRLASGGVNVMLVGPAGCGKTHLFSQVAHTLNREYASISGSAGASESQLIGRLLPTGEGGRFEYHPSPFIQMYESGGMFLFDEIDAFDPNMLIVTNQATANGSFIVEARSAKPRVVKHDKTILMGAANTFGVGAGAMYVGRNQLDAATLDRWYVVEMDYDTAFEATLATQEVLKWVWGLRQKCQANRLRRVVSTRMIQKVSMALKVGIPFKEVRKDLLSGWTKDELAKVGEAA